MEKMYVPESLERHIVEKLQELTDDNRLPENYAGMFDTQVDTVEHMSRDGFIPFTNGGFDIMLPTELAHVWGSGNGPSNEAISKQLDEIIESSQQLALESFVYENKSVFEEIFPDADLNNPTFDLINYHDLYDMGHGALAEKLSEYEYDYLSEGGTLWYQFRVLYYSADNSRNESGDDEILFMAGVNLDLEYGRDSGLEITYEECVPVELLTTEEVDAIINNMVESI
jgi:hypothetical protein